MLGQGQSKAIAVIALSYWIVVTLAFRQFASEHTVAFLILAWAGFALLIYAFVDKP
jgi:hypothetical protein